MKKEDKALVIEKIANTLKEYSCFYLTDTTGMNAERTSELRRACFKADVKMVVVKNTLLHKVLEAADVMHLQRPLRRSLKKTTPFRRSKLRTLKRPYMLEQINSIRLRTSRARTSLSPTLWLSFNHRPRMLSLLCSLQVTSCTVSSKPYPTNNSKLKTIKKSYYNGRFKIFCRTIS